MQTGRSGRHTGHGGARRGQERRATPLLLAGLLACAACRPFASDQPAPRPGQQPPGTGTDSGLPPGSAPDAGEATPADCLRPAATETQGIFYEIFVRSFQDSDGDGVGDLDGVRSRLGQLQQLGVTGLWLTPIFRSPSYHGYDTTDYEQVDPAYGGNEALQRLLDEAHRRGMVVLLDLVLNHTSSQHPWFQESASGPASPRRCWYVWRDAEPTPRWTQPWSRSPVWFQSKSSWYYGLFWSEMPDLNYTEPAVRSEMKRLARLWLERGVDGYRLDAVRYLFESGAGEGQADTPETHAFLRELAQELTPAHPGALLIGEVWTDLDRVARYFGTRSGEELSGAFDFDLADALLADVAAASPDRFPQVLCRVAAAFPAHARDATFLTNHDQDRVMTRLSGSAAAARMAAILLLTLPGTPFLYYGEEIGMVNGAEHGDPGKRTPMQWAAGAGGGFTTGQPWEPLAPAGPAANVAAQQADPASLLQLYRRLIALRRSQPALDRGDYRPLPVQATVGGSACFAFLRQGGGSVALVLANLGRSEAGEVEVELPADIVLPATPLLLHVEPQGGAAAPLPAAALRPGNRLRLATLAARSAAVLTGER